MRARIGIYDLQLRDGGGGSKRGLVMAERLSGRYDVTLLHGEPCEVASLARSCGVEMAGFRTFQLRLPVQNLARRTMVACPGDCLRKAGLEAQLVRAHRALEPLYERQLRRLNLDLFINNQFYSVLPCPAPRGIYMCMFPHELRGQPRHAEGAGPLERIYGHVFNRVRGITPQVLDSYGVITANSSFTAEWIGRLWQRSAEVVYSAAEPMGPATTKEKLILHVGRFVASHRLDYKHQHTLLQVFRQLTDLHARGWQIHFAGNVQPDRESVSALELVRAGAAGLPALIHPNCGHGALRDLYRRASIYWHATGYGTAADADPARQEHFGITIAEAMSAGAVPVVLNSGGPRETIQDGRTGCRWDTLDELAQTTRRLAGDPDTLRAMSSEAVASSGRFCRSAFADRIEHIVDRLLG